MEDLPLGRIAALVPEFALRQNTDHDNEYLICLIETKCCVLHLRVRARVMHRNCVYTDVYVGYLL